ncbi:unnamed protein product [Rotaria sp. Silwood2]|nr:unnamed protein product [Rotaria sp. Silwood2]
MTDAGFFKGTSAEQDSRFANKQKKLLKQMKFPDNIDVKIDMLKVNLDVLKPWITKRLQELLGIEDDVVIEFVFNQLEDKHPDPKMMQINLTGFLGGSKARVFIGELWKLLASAQSSPDGIPAECVEMKKRELLKRQEEDNRLREIRKREEDSHRQDIKPDIDKLDNKINGRNPTASSSNKSRNEHDVAVEYKSRSYHNDDRRDHDRRRLSPKNHRIRDSRSPDLRTRNNDKKPTRPISDISENEDNHHRHYEKPKQNLKSSSNRYERHRSRSKSPLHSRSPIKSSRKNEKHQQQSSSELQNTSYQTTKKPEKIKPKPKTRSSSSSSNDSHSYQRHDKSSRKKVNDISNESNEIKRQKINENNNLTIDNQVKKQPVSKTKRKSLTPSPPRSKQSTKTSSKPTSNIEKPKPKVSPIKETKKNKKQSKRARSSSINSSSISRSISNSSFSSLTSSLASISESETNKKPKKKPQLTKTGSSSRSRSSSPNRNRKFDKKKDDHKSRKHSTHNSLELYCKWKPINLDHLDKSITKKTHRNESSKKKKDKNEHKDKTNSNSYQSSSNNEIPQSSSPKRPRLESQIKVQTPPPPKLPDDNKSQQELVRQPSTSIKPNRTERIVVLEESRTDSIDSISARVSISTKINDNEEHQNKSPSEDENEIDLRERLLREKAIKSMRRRQNLAANNDNNTNINTKTTTDRIVYETQ